MHGAKLPLRIAIFAIGIMIMAFGVAFSIKADLGISPISSLPYVTSVISRQSVGTTTIIINMLMIAIQFAVLRGRSDAFMLLQIPATLVFGIMIDFASFAIDGISSSSYLGQWGFALISIVLLGTGISLEMLSRITTTAGEGLVKSISMIVPIRFSTLKVLFDVSLVALSSLISLIGIGRIIGIREGTAAAMILVGTTVKILKKPLSPIGKAVLPKQQKIN